MMQEVILTRDNNLSIHRLTVWLPGPSRKLRSDSGIPDL